MGDLSRDSPVPCSLDPPPPAMGLSLVSCPCIVLSHMHVDTHTSWCPEPILTYQHSVWGPWGLTRWGSLLCLPVHLSASPT